MMLILLETSSYVCLDFRVSGRTKGISTKPTKNPHHVIVKHVVSKIGGLVQPKLHLFMIFLFDYISSFTPPLKPLKYIQSKRNPSIL